MTLVYDDYDSLLTVTDKNAKLTCSYSKDYQPGRLIGLTDTVGYYSQFYKNGMAVSANYAFNIEHRHAGGERVVYAILLNGQSLSPDSMHCADSLRIARTTGSGYDIEKYKLTYSTTDNRRQSVDVNQLVFGTEACDPYQLLALFRYARNTSIVSRMSSEAGEIVVEVELNADRSVSKMTVKRSSESDVPLTYTFEY